MLSQECKSNINTRTQKLAIYLEHLKAGIQSGDAEYLESSIGEMTELLGNTLKYIQFCERTGT